jgi:hypothetical protein
MLCVVFRDEMRWIAVSRRVPELDVLAVSDVNYSKVGVALWRILDKDAALLSRCMLL